MRPHFHMPAPIMPRSPRGLRKRPDGDASMDTDFDSTRKDPRMNTPAAAPSAEPQHSETRPALPAPRQSPELMPKMHKAPHRWPVVLIGIGKLFKAITLIAVSFFFNALIKEEQHKQVEDWLSDALLRPHSEIVHALYNSLERLLGVSNQQLRIIHVGVLIYAGLYLIEGVGLLFDKKWAEWMVIVTTAGFIPFELYEIGHAFNTDHHIHWTGVTVFTLNVIILLYLCFRLHRAAVVKREMAAFPLLAAKS
jgi:uncharacterized membrane protein (DUF2068 family)